jgi:hypothetical protein
MALKGLPRPAGQPQQQAQTSRPRSPIIGAKPIWSGLGKRSD